MVQDWPGERPDYGRTAGGEEEPLLVDSLGRLILSPLTTITGTFTPPLGTVGIPSTVTVSNVISTLLLAADSTRIGFVFDSPVGVVYIGLGFNPTSTSYTYRMTNNSQVEKDYFVGPVYGLAVGSPKSIYITEIK